MIRFQSSNDIIWMNIDTKKDINFFIFPIGIGKGIRQKSINYPITLNHIVLELISLLIVTSVQNTANIIGHSYIIDHRDIKSTMTYKRYALNKKEI